MKSTIAKKSEGYGYKYTELADINKYCEEQGIRYFQEIETNEINQKDYIITTLISYNDKGEPHFTKHRGCQIVEAKLSGINNPVQAYGSSLTYCRRYSLLMALGLATEDNDAADLTEVENMTEEQAKEVVITFGKHKGKKMADLIEDKGYIGYLVNNIKDQKILKAIEVLTGEHPRTDEEWDEKLELSQKLMRIIVDKELDTDAICEYYKVNELKELKEDQIKEIIEKRG
jgi:hypothetical protein